METRNCQNCKKDFTVQERDFSFYQKIKVPPPTWCPDCRCIRRMVHRNERNLFRRVCDVTGKNIISIYRPDCPYTICDKDYYFSDNFDPFKYGVKYDLNKEFFPQFYEFAKKVPMASLFVRNSENCDYNQDMSGASNCYLCSRTHDSDNVFYGYRINKSSYCNDCFQAVEGSEFLFECVDCTTCSNSSYLHLCEKCSDSAFLYNCAGCVDCFMCTDLRNKNYCYKNQQYTREEYKKIVEGYNLSSYAGQQKALKEFEEYIRQFPRKNLNILRSNNVSGDNIDDSKDSYNVWNVRGLQNCSYIWDSFNFTDSMDTYSGAAVDLVYESTATTAHSSNCHFTIRAYKGSRDCEYSWFMANCSNCFGCISLTNKQYCIFNVQYEKEEYEKLLPQIIEKMKIDKEYGEFFPLYMSPFPYNDTVAHEYYPLTEKRVSELGMKWGDFEEKNYKATIDGKDLPDDIKDVTDEILKEIISCVDGGSCTHGCTKAFRIVEGELAFYRRRNIPLPRKCPNCRYYRRLVYRNPTNLRKTMCMCMGENLSNGVYQNTILHSHGASPCGKNIETSIASDAGEIIYCDECYKAEVY
jgi:hypothetical protein